MRYRFHLTVLFAALLLACTAPAGIRDISAEDLLARPVGDETLILDVRTPKEFASGHVPGAVNIPYDQVSDRLAELESHRDSDVVIYCEKGGRAGKAAEVLTGAQFPSLLHLSGDMSEWREAGRPMEN